MGLLAAQDSIIITMQNTRNAITKICKSKYSLLEEHDVGHYVHLHVFLNLTTTKVTSKLCSNSTVTRYACKSLYFYAAIQIPITSLCTLTETCLKKHQIN